MGRYSSHQALASRIRSLQFSRSIACVLQFPTPRNDLLMSSIVSSHRLRDFPIDLVPLVRPLNTFFGILMSSIRCKCRALSEFINQNLLDGFVLVSKAFDIWCRNFTLTRKWSESQFALLYEWTSKPIASGWVRDLSDYMSQIANISHFDVKFRSFTDFFWRH